MATYISQRFVIESDQDDVEVMVDAEGKVFFGALSGHTYFQLSKDEWAELVHFVQKMSREEP